MTEQYYDPDTLATRLDDLLSDANPALTGDDPLLETALRLHDAPQPALSADALSRIEQGLFDVQPGVTANSSNGTWPGIAALVAVAAALLVAVVIVGNSGDNTSDTAGGDALPNIADLLELPPAIMIEGPVAAIDDTSITIHIITFDVSHDPALLDTIAVGDLVHIDGAALDSGDETQFVALDIVPIDDVGSSLLPVLLPPGQEDAADSGAATSDASAGSTGSTGSGAGNGSDSQGSEASAGDDGDRGHGNDADRDDEDNPGQGNRGN